VPGLELRLLLLDQVIDPREIELDGLAYGHADRPPIA
jgi:hypothetical protein